MVHANIVEPTRAGRYRPGKHAAGFWNRDVAVLREASRGAFLGFVNQFTGYRIWRPTFASSSHLDAFVGALLPRLEPIQNELHLNATILEVSEPAQLAELAADGKIRRFLLGRLSDTAALVDPGSANLLEDALLAAGHTPKIT